MRHKYTLMVNTLNVTTNQKIASNNPNNARTLGHLKELGDERKHVTCCAVPCTWVSEIFNRRDLFMFTVTM